MNMGPCVFHLLSLSVVGLTAAWPGYFISAEECGGQEMSVSEEIFVSYSEDLSPGISKELSASKLKYVMPIMEDGLPTSPPFHRMEYINPDYPPHYVFESFMPAKLSKPNLCRLKKPTTTQRPTTTTVESEESDSSSWEPEQPLPECGPSTTTTPRPPCKPRIKPTPRPASAVAAVQVVPVVAKAKPPPKLKSVVNVGVQTPRLPKCGPATTTQSPGGCGPEDLSTSIDASEGDSRFMDAGFIGKNHEESFVEHFKQVGTVDDKMSKKIFPQYMATSGKNQLLKSEIADFFHHYFSQGGPKKDANQMHVNIQNQNVWDDGDGEDRRAKQNPGPKSKGRKEKKYVEQVYELEKDDEKYQLEKGEDKYLKHQPVIIVNKNEKQKYNKPVKNSNYYTRPDGSKWWYITNEKKNYY